MGECFHLFILTARPVSFSILLLVTNLLLEFLWLLSSFFCFFWLCFLSVLSGSADDKGRTTFTLGVLPSDNMRLSTPDLNFHLGLLLTTVDLLLYWRAHRANLIQSNHGTDIGCAGVSMCAGNRRHEAEGAGRWLTSTSTALSHFTLKGFSTECFWCTKVINNLMIFLLCISWRAAVTAGALQMKPVRSKRGTGPGR